MEPASIECGVSHSARKATTRSVQGLLNFSKRYSQANQSVPPSRFSALARLFSHRTKQMALVRPPSTFCNTLKSSCVVLNCRFSLGQPSAALNFPQLRVPFPWLDRIPQALQLLAAGNVFNRRAFLFAVFLPGSLIACFMLLPPITGVLPRFPVFGRIPRASPPTRRPVLNAATRSLPSFNGPSSPLTSHCQQHLGRTCLCSPPQSAPVTSSARGQGQPGNTTYFVVLVSQLLQLFVA